MPTMSGHTTAIMASKVTGTTVYNTAGEEIGHIEDIVLEKTSDRIKFVVIGFGGFLGIGEKYHALPGSMLDYDEANGGYVVSLTRDELERAPAYDLDALTASDGLGTVTTDYYDQYRH